MAAVEWEPRPGVRLMADPAHLRLAGAGVALAIGSAEAVIGSLVFQVDALWVGAASVTLLGWCLGPAAVRRPVATAAAMAILSVLLSALVVSALLLGHGGGATGDLSAVVVVPYLALIGVIFLGLPALALTGPSSIAWLIGVRWLANGRGSPAPG